MPLQDPRKRRPGPPSPQPSPGRRVGPKKRAKKGRLNLPPGPGRAGEAAAEAHLRSEGYRILARNYRTREGEVDIIAWDGDVVAFVEVKTRRSPTMKFGAPEESLTRAKQAHLIAAAQAYLAENALLDADWRIDVLAVELDRAGRVLRADLLKGAVEAID